MAGRGRPPLEDPAMVRETGVYVALSDDEKSLYYEMAERDREEYVDEPHHKASVGAWLRWLAEQRIARVEKQARRRTKK